MKCLTKCAALTMAAALMLTACSQKAVVAETEAEVIAVAAAAAERGSLTHETSYSGRISPAESVYIIGKASGTVSKTYFEIGDKVKAGDLLYEIDPVDIMLSVNQAQAAYDAAAAQVALQTGSTLDAQALQAKSSEEQAYFGYQSARDAYNDLEEAIDDLDSAITRVRNTPAEAFAGYASSATDLPKETVRAIKKSGLTVDDYTINGKFDAAGYKADMISNLQSQKNSLDSNLERAKIARRQASSGYNTASDAVDLTTGKATDQAVAAANASLGQARAALELAQAQIDYCKVTTPISGIVEMKNVEVNGMSAPSTPAYVISNKDTMQVTFGVPAETSRKLEVGDPITVENGKITHTAVITEIGTMIDQTSGLFTVKANITDECADLLTGIAVKLSATTDRAENALLIPAAAIYYDEGSAYVYVVRNGAAAKTFVETGIFTDDTAEITDGLSDGDLVITTWDSHLRDGMLVSVKEG